MALPTYMKDVNPWDPGAVYRKHLADKAAKGQLVHGDDHQIGLLDSLGHMMTGITSEDVDQIEAHKKYKADGKAGQTALNNSGFKGTLGLADKDYITVGDVNQAIESKKEKKTQEIRTQTNKDNLEYLGKSQAPVISGQKLTAESTDKQTVELGRQFDINSADKKAERAADSLLQIKLAEMQQSGDRERYEQDRMYYEQDKKEANIQALVASLASLGAAFAI